MSIIRALRPKTEERAATVPLWQLHNLFGIGPGGYTTATSVEKALTYSAVWACIDVITDAISRTPVDVVRYRNGARVNVEPRPKLIAYPNRTLVTEDVWRTQVAFSLATHGNAFGVVLSEDGGGYPTAVQLVDPYVVGMEMKDGLKWLNFDGRHHRTWQDGGDFFHIPGRHVRAASPYGLSPAQYAGETIGLGIAARQFANEFFTNGHPDWMFSTEQPLTETQATDLKKAIQTSMRPGSRDPLVYGSGLKATQVSPQVGETGHIDTMRYINEEASRVWRIPPSAISASMSGQSVTYASIGEQDIQLVKNTLDGYYVRIETALTGCLPQPQVVKFNRNAILRSDVKTRNEIYDVRLKNKTMTVNEVRALEDEEPFTDPMYDDPGIPGGPILAGPDPKANDVAPV